MIQDFRKPILDFSEYITERTHDFTGREWVFKSIDDWLADTTSGSRFFLLEGEPGSGKTAIAARLSQISQGVIPHQHLTALTRGVISAIHFCNARDAKLTDPFAFVDSVATQLANCYPDYLDLLNNLNNNRQIQITVQQDIQQIVNGQVVGVIINVHAPAPESAFNRAVREPLETLLQARTHEQVVLLVDALDEALTHSGISNIVTLLARTASLSPQIRFILTTRSEGQVVNQFENPKKLSLSLPHNEHSREDIRRYVKMRLKDDPLLAEILREKDHEQVAQLIEMLPLKADGNFQYARFVLDSMARGLRGLLDLEELPAGLDRLYFDSLNRVVQRKELGKKRDWFTDYRPLLGMLTVAQENLTIDHLRAFTSLSEEAIRQYLFDDLQQFIEKVEVRDEQGATIRGYRLFHESFRDFLHTQSIIRNGEQEENRFFLPKENWHEALADRCEGGDIAKIWEEDRYQPPPEQTRRKYARRHYITHLYQSKQYQRLFAVLDAGQYGQGKIADDPGMSSYAQDLDLGRRAAEEQGEDSSVRLWRYSLLRCSLTSRADAYPSGAFQMLLALGREKETLGLANLLTKSDVQAQILLQIARHLLQQSRRKQDGIQILLRAEKTAHTATPSTLQTTVLVEIGELFFSLHQPNDAKRVLVEATLQIQQLRERSHEMWKVIEKLGVALAQGGMWEDGEKMANALEEDDTYSDAYGGLAEGCIQVQEWERARAFINKIQWEPRQGELLGKLGVAYLQAQKEEEAEAVWSEAEALLDKSDGPVDKTRGLQYLATTLLQIPQEDRVKRLLGRAEAVSKTIEVYGGSKDLGFSEKMKTLMELTEILIEAHQLAEARRVVSELTVTLPPARNIWLLSKLGRILALTGQIELAENIWEQAKKEIHLLDQKEQENKQNDLLECQIQARQWESAQKTMDMLDTLHAKRDNRYRSEDQPIYQLSRLGMALAQANQWERVVVIAERIIATSEFYWEKKVSYLSKLGVVAVEAQQERYVELLMQKVHLSVAKGLSSDYSENLDEIIKILIRERQWELAKKASCALGLKWLTARGLKNLTEGLEKELMWDKALEILMMLEPLSEDYVKSGEFRLSLKKLAYDGRWRQAKARVEQETNPVIQVELLSGLGTVLHQTKQRKPAEILLEEAAHVFSTIKDDKKNEEALDCLGEAFIASERWEKAFELAITSDTWYYWEGRKAHVLENYINRIEQAHQWKKIEKVLQTVTAEKNSVMLKDLGTLSIKARQWAIVTIIINLFRASKKNYLQEVLTDFGILLLEMDKKDLSETLLQEAEDIAFEQDKRESKYYNERTPYFIREIIGARQLNRAKKAIQRLRRGANKAKLLIELGDALFRSQELASAEDAWKEAYLRFPFMEDTDRVEIVCALGNAFAQTQQWERAKAMWDEAESIIAQIAVREVRTREHQEYRDHDIVTATQCLGNSLLQAQQWDQARAIGLSTAQEIERLKHIGKISIEEQHWEQTVVVARQLERLAEQFIEHDDKIKLLHDITDLLQQTDRKEEILSVFQRALLQSKTREYCLKLLSFIYQDISTNPELAVKFCQGFSWVDAFLEGRSFMIQE